MRKSTVGLNRNLLIPIDAFTRCNLMMGFARLDELRHRLQAAGKLELVARSRMLCLLLSKARDAEL